MNPLVSNGQQLLAPPPLPYIWGLWSRWRLSLVWSTFSLFQAWECAERQIKVQVATVTHVPQCSFNSCNVSDAIIQLLFNSQEMVEDSPLDLIWSKLTFITHHNRETTLYKGRQFTELPIQEYTFSVGPIRSGIPDLVRIRTKVAKMVRNWVPWSGFIFGCPCYDWIAQCDNGQRSMTLVFRWWMSALLNTICNVYVCS